jgi:formamidopyrimidine-DNA glycosylase
MIKRSLTARKFLSGIGKACSDEILHHARISPMRQIRYFEDDEWQRLFDSKQKALVLWIEKLRAETGDKFPAKITAFHADMAVHGKYKAPCPDCGKPVQRIRYASNECNYCANCQNQGNLLADQSLSSLLKKDWPKTLEELGKLYLKSTCVGPRRPLLHSDRTKTCAPQSVRRNARPHKNIHLIRASQKTLRALYKPASLSLT